MAQVHLYVLIGCLLAFALIVVLFLLFLRFWRRRRSSDKSCDELEKALAADADTKNGENSFPARSTQCLLSNYGAASPTKRTLSMDSIGSNPEMKTQSVQPIIKPTPLRQASFPSRNSSCDDKEQIDDETTDEYDYENLKKYGPPMDKKAVRTQSASSAVVRRQSSQSFSSNDAAIGTIKPDLYLRKGSLYFQTGEGGESSNIGKVHLRFRYDFRRSDFIVTAIQAELPTDVHDCYLKMFLTPDESGSTTGGSGGCNKPCRQSKVRRRSAAFAFNEEFKFPVAFSELMEKTLVVQAFDCARGQHQVGAVRLELRKADPSADIEVLADLTKIRVTETVSGCLEVALSYLPSVQRLTVSIIQAKGLRIEELTDSSDAVGIYVRCSLFQNGSKVAAKKKKTSAVHVAIARDEEAQKVDASWKEQVVFHVLENACKSSSLQLCVCAKQARGSSDKILGQLDLGSEESNRECRQHWRQMLREKIESSVWHKLQMPVNEDATGRLASSSSRPQDDGD